jgi:hypothetical protein
MGGGSTPSVTSSNQTSNPWSGVQEPMLSVVNQAGQLYSTPYTPYMGSTIAAMSDSGIAAQNGIYQRATLGAPDLNAARGYATDLSTGQFMNQGPTSNNGYLASMANGQQAGPTSQNAWLNSTANGGQIGANPWLSSQYTDAVIGQNAANMGNAMAIGGAAQADANFARGGAYGGSAHQLAQNQNMSTLANQVGQMANTYRLANQQMGVQDYQNAVGAGLSAAGQQQNAYGMDSTNMLNAAGQQQNAYNSDVAARMQGAQLGGQLSQDDYTSLNMLRQQGVDQRAMEQQYLTKAEQDYNAAQNFPQQSLTNYANLLSQFGGFGSSGTTATYGSGQSNLGLGVGAGLLGLGAYNALGKGF